MGTNWSTGSFIWTWGRASSLWAWRSTGTGCPGRSWSLLLWGYSRPAWTRSCAACCRWPCFGRRVGLDDPQRSLPTPTILWFCDSCRTFLLFHAPFSLLLPIFYQNKHSRKSPPGGLPYFLEAWYFFGNSAVFAPFLLKSLCDCCNFKYISSKCCYFFLWFQSLVHISVPFSLPKLSFSSK